MKKTIKSAKMLTTGLLALCTMGIANVTFAGATKNENPVEVIYLGAIRNQYSIQLNLNNNEAGTYFVNFKGMDHHILGSEIIQGAHLSEIFKLDVDEDVSSNPVSELRIEVTSEKTHTTRVYKVNTLTGKVQN